MRIASQKSEDATTTASKMMVNFFMIHLLLYPRLCGNLTLQKLVFKIPFPKLNSGVFLAEATSTILAEDLGGYGIIPSCAHRSKNSFP